MLKRGGWHEGHRPGWDRIRKWTRLCGEEDRFAEEFLEAFADIEVSIDLPGDTPQDWGERTAEMNPLSNLEYFDRAMLDRISETAGERILPVGKENSSNILLLGNHGRFFKMIPGYHDVYCLGEGWDGLLHYLQTGDYTMIFKRCDR